MTWTLRLYDNEGVEIANATATPLDWEITYPDPGTVDSLKRFFYKHEDGYEPISPTKEQFDGGFLVSERIATYNGSPKEHLEWVKSDAETWADYIGSITLVDE